MISPYTFSWTLVKALLAVAGLVAAAVVIPYFVMFHGPPSQQQDAWGQFGDYVGGVLNPAFAFLSFGAVLVALVLQSKELHDSTEQLRASAAALTEQRALMARQSFENTYFQMLRRVSDIVNDTVWRGSRGQGLWDDLYNGHLYRSLREHPDTDEAAREAYALFYKEARAVLGHYFRTLYHVFVFVDKAELGESDKVRYANIARAQLSESELLLLFYNGIVGEGASGFRPLVEQYGLLKHVTREKLARPSHATNTAFYSPTAFMSADERKAYRERGSLEGVSLKSTAV